MPKAVHLICIFVLIKYLMTYHKCYSVVSVARPSRVCVLSRSLAIAGGVRHAFTRPSEIKFNHGKRENAQSWLSTGTVAARTGAVQFSASLWLACTSKMTNIARLTLIAITVSGILMSHIMSALWTYNGSHPRCHWYIQPTRCIPLLAGRLFM